jgi:hypothetical protein
MQKILAGMKGVAKFIAMLIGGALMNGIVGGLAVMSVVAIAKIAVPLLPTVTATTTWALFLLVVMTVSGSLFFKNNASIICLPRIGKLVGKWWVIPDWVLKKSEFFQGLYCSVTMWWGVIYLGFAVMAVIVSFPAVIIFLSGWYFHWLTSEVRSGNVRLWPWLVKTLHKATTPPLRKKVRVKATA